MHSAEVDQKQHTFTEGEQAKPPDVALAPLGDGVHRQLVFSTNSHTLRV